MTGYECSRCQAGQFFLCLIVDGYFSEPEVKYHLPQKTSRAARPWFGVVQGGNSFGPLTRNGLLETKITPSVWLLKFK